MTGPDSWKSKCAIRRADDVAMTEDGTLIMRCQSSAPPGSVNADETARMPSLAPFAVDQRLDEEDFFEPARNCDAMGLRSTQSFHPPGRASSLAGLSAGLSALMVAAGIAFVAFTGERPSHLTRMPRFAAHGTSTLTVVGPELAMEKAVSKPIRHHARRLAAPAAETLAEPTVEALETD